MINNVVINDSHDDNTYCRIIEGTIHMQKCTGGMNRARERILNNENVRRQHK